MPPSKRSHDASTKDVHPLANPFTTVDWPLRRRTTPTPPADGASPPGALTLSEGAASFVTPTAKKAARAPTNARKVSQPRSKKAKTNPAPATKDASLAKLSVATAIKEPPSLSAFMEMYEALKGKHDLTSILVPVATAPPTATSMAPVPLPLLKNVTGSIPHVAGPTTCAPLPTA